MEIVECDRHVGTVSFIQALNICTENSLATLEKSWLRIEAWCMGATWINLIDRIYICESMLNHSKNLPISGAEK